MKKFFKISITIVILVLLSFSQGFQVQVFADDESGSKTIDDIFSEADDFLNKDENQEVLNVKGTSDIIYNVLLAIGMITAVIVGLILGI